MADTGNRQRLLQLNGSTRVERLACVGLLRDAILAKGWIMDFHEYSNLSICIEFEMPASSLPRLGEALVAAKVSLSAKTEQMLDNLQSTQSFDLVQCTLQVLFIHDEPDLRRTVLAVPG